MSLLVGSADTYNRIDTCWRDMSRVRSNSLCSICSGRSEVFFSKDRAVIKGETCHRLMDSCHRFFLVVIHLVSGIDTLIGASNRPNRRSDSRKK